MFQDNWLGGNHTIKVGYLSERESNEATDGGFLDSLTVQFNSTGGAAPFSTPYRVQIQNTPRVQTNANWHHGAYINDSIQIAQRLTASLGLRWDYYESFFPDQIIPDTPVAELLLRRRADSDLGRSLLAAAHVVCRQQLHRAGRRAASAAIRR